jgi:hypothetical protein
MLYVSSSPLSASIFYIQNKDNEKNNTTRGFFVKKIYGKHYFKCLFITNKEMTSKTKEGYK